MTRDYTRQYYTTYVETSVALELIPFKQWKLSKFKMSRGTSVMAKIKNIWKIKKVFAKGIKSINLNHIQSRHAYWSAPLDASKYLKWADIEGLIKEGYGKPNKKFVETMSWNRPSIEIEVDMWRIIWISNKETSKLRIIVGYGGNVISSYPIDNFSF